MALSDNLAKLPECCYAVNGVTGEVIVLKRGCSGYWPTEIAAQNKEESEAIVNKFNEQLSVTKAQAAAMYFGSLFGFDVPGADPDVYDEDGKLKNRAKT